ncbi:hypothetical protein FRB99_008314 [Tulasnella sp. 403]|nr:hypothetical protein FRB99_008314 [Tulasnella sp. 403]
MVLRLVGTQATPKASDIDHAADSVTQEHFFSLSCSLYPHVRATPDYSGRYDWDRAWPQNLYLHPESPLLSRINFPAGFDINKTPLATFRRVDLLFNRTEIETQHNGGGWRPGPGENSTLFGDEASWDMSPTEYFDIFLSPEPNNYHTIILSTAGHWSLRLFAGLPRGYPEIYDLFRTVITNWVYQAGKYLDSEAAKGREKEVIVRPYLPGDDNCHSDKIQNGGPVKQPLSLEWASYNWGWIPRLNAVFEEAIVARGHPNLHYVAVDRPGRLRPDAADFPPPTDVKQTHRQASYWLQWQRITLVVFVIIVATLSPFPFDNPISRHLAKRPRPSPMCAPLEWASGSWVLKRDAVHIVSGDGVHGPSGFLGCASTRNASWHLGTDREEELNWRSYASSYDYVPGGLCGSRMARFSPEKMVIDLVQNGGWLLVGGTHTLKTVDLDVVP